MPRSDARGSGRDARGVRRARGSGRDARGVRRARGRRRDARGMTMVETAIGIAIFGSLLAGAVPAYVHELHGSRHVEPVAGLERLGASAVAYAHERTVADAFPESATQTPPVVPRGKAALDPPGVWDTPA